MSEFAEKNKNTITITVNKDFDSAAEDVVKQAEKSSKKWINLEWTFIEIMFLEIKYRGTWLVL